MTTNGLRRIVIVSENVSLAFTSRRQCTFPEIPSPFCRRGIPNIARRPAAATTRRDFSSSGTEDTSKEPAQPSSPSTEPTTTQNPMVRLWHQIRQFPSGISRLRRDVHTYRNISAASRTPRNAWTVVTKNDPAIHHPDNPERPWEGLLRHRRKHPNCRIPRRHRRQQIELLEDLATALPVVTGYVAVPILGNIFIVVGLSFPRILLSRQFHPREQVRSFAENGYREKWGYFERLRGRKGGGTGRDDEDPHGWISPVGTWDALDGESLILLTMAHVNSMQLVPERLVRALVPPSLLILRLRSFAREMIKDDALLLEEGYHLNRCGSLTDMEVLSACVLRGLDTRKCVEFWEMRESLTGYLELVKCMLEERGGIGEDPEGLELAVLHLTPLFISGNAGVGEKRI